MTHWNTDLTDAVAAMAERVGLDTATPASGPDAAFWSALTEAGFTGIGIPEEHGGSGGSTTDALSVLHAAVGHGALTGLVEHTLLAGRLVAECTGRAASGPATVVIAGADCRARATGEGAVLDGSVSGVVHGDDATVLVVVLPAHEADARPTIAVVATDAPGITVERGADLLGAALDDVRFESTPAQLFESPVGAAELEQRGALAYAVALTAAAGAVRDRTSQYAAQRVQFGRPLAKFQAVQQRLAGIAARAALMETAAAAAARQAEQDAATARTAIAAAKVVTAAAAREVAAAGHQIHGAIGFTSEHSLGRSTAALWSWRDRYGSERRWARALAEQILDDGADPWDLVTGFDPAPATTSGSRAESIGRTPASDNAAERNPR